MKGKKTGGRKAGTPNKINKAVRTVIAKITEDYYNSEKFAEDIEKLDARDRISAMERFTAYIVPRLQNTSLDVASEGNVTIETTLSKLID